MGIIFFKINFSFYENYSPKLSGMGFNYKVAYVELHFFIYHKQLFLIY